MKKLKGVDGKLDIAWSLLVKLKAGMKCEIQGCGKTKCLNSHHIFTRKNSSVRWCADNGVALCPSHHTLSPSFSAHGTPVKFVDWLRNYRGHNFVDVLTLKSNQISKLYLFEKEIILKELNKEIKSYE